MLVLEHRWCWRFDKKTKVMQNLPLTLEIYKELMYVYNILNCSKGTNHHRSLRISCFN